MSTEESGPRPEDLALLRLLQMPRARYEELLAVPAEYALEYLDAASVSLSRWERDRGLVRTVVNVGALGPSEVRFPQDEVFDLATYEEVLDLGRGIGVTYDHRDPDLSYAGADLLRRYDHVAALSVPVHLDGRVWGIVWATKNSGPLASDAMTKATRVAEAIAPMIAIAERLQTMSRLAFEDPLTGLGNRRMVDDGLADLLRGDGPDAGPGATTVVCDVDGLKAVNDDHGHEAGDRVIVAVADALAEAASAVPGALVVRLGGDEFAVVLPGAARTAAISLVEAAAARLRPDAIAISCGIAAVPPGTSARDALAIADGAQYAAKRRGALLVVASDLEAATATRRRRRASDRAPAAETMLATDARQAVADAVRLLAQNLPDAPTSARGRFEWLGEQLLEPLDLDHWTVSSVDLTVTPSLLLVSSMGMRVGRPPHEAAADLFTDHPFDLDAYPWSARAIRECGWFCVDAYDPATEPAEREVLEAMGKRYVLAVGCSEGGRGALLELYGRCDQLDLRLLGSTLGLAASAVLGTTVSQLDTTPARMSP